MMSARENKRERTPKTKGDIELPKISRTLNIQASYLDRYEWITRNTQYVLLSTPAVEQQQQYLNTQLSSLNQEYTDLLKNINTYINVKPLRKSKQTNINDKASEIRDIEIQNNNTVIGKLRVQNELLYRRISSVSNGRNQYDIAVIETRQKILKAKQKIKELKLRSKEMGQNIQSGQDGFVELQRLQQEYKASELKRRRQQQKLTISEANLKNLLDKLQQINVEWIEAESWLSQHFSVERATEQERSMDQQFKQKTYQLEITKKMLQSLRNTKQQKYLQLLRGLEQDVQKIKLFDKKLQKLQVKNLYQKKELMELQDLLSQTMSLKKSRSKTSQKNSQVPPNDQILELSQSKKQFSKYSINLTKDNHNINNGSLTKIDARKYYVNRLYSSNTKPVLLQHTKQLTFEKDRLLNEVKAINKTEIYEKKPYQEESISQMTSMMNEALPHLNRTIFRTSKSKLKEETKEKEKVKFQKLDADQKLEQRVIEEESMECSPVKQAYETHQRPNQQKLENIVSQQMQDCQGQKEQQKEEEQLQRKKNLISNYMEQLQEDDQ